MPVPGLNQQEDVIMGGPANPTVFIAEMADSNVIVYRGQRIEVFYAGESEDLVAAGDRVRCLSVPEMRQVFVIEKIA